MLSDYSARSGHFAPVFTLEIQTVPEDTDRLMDAIMKVHPLAYGRYERNASVSAGGAETVRPMAQSTTTLHKPDYSAGGIETYPMVALKISIERDLNVLKRVMTALLDVHPYEQPVIYLCEDWASRAAYTPNNANPNRWWHKGRGLPQQIAKRDSR